MASSFQGKRGVLLLILLFAFGLVCSSAFSYWGIGVQTIGQAHLRAGSVIAPAWSEAALAPVNNMHASETVCYCPDHE